MEFLNFSEANCKNCYKCLRHCPVKAIQIKDEQAQIIEERCIGCGECFAVCPQNARKIKSDIKNVKNAIDQGKTIIASIAPSFMGAFDIKNGGEIVNALKKLGFNYVEETAVGAQVVAELYKNYINDNEQENYITTCCPSANYLIEKYYPALIKYMIPTVSPMIAHGKLIKNKYGQDSYVVFIGPCTSKKLEAVDVQHEGVINAVLTFEELDCWLNEKEITLEELEPMDFNKLAYRKGCSFPIGGGVLSCVINDGNKNKKEFLAVDGTNECMEVFESLVNGHIKNTCIEVNVCKGSCIGGMAMPKREENIYIRRQRVKNYAKNKKDINNKKELQLQESINYNRQFFNKYNKTYVTNEKIEDVLRQMGKFTLEDELNCGGCGYNTCRQKAKAVILGMAEINMCLPFMRSKAEGLINVIFENSPNAIFIVDNEMLIKEINPIVERIFNVNVFEVKDKPLSMIIDDTEFKKVRDTKENILKKKVAYSSENVVLIQNIIYVEKQNVILAIMADVTKEEKNMKKLSEVKENTLNVAQRVIDKQMRVAQEIASLLGETTAETKATLTKLKRITIEEKGDL